ncbi:alpha/beta hydrolase [Sporosarcina sp. G11-34]|uniref:alpha/beta hydrolase n=1 Tax=Sporosarcina sp. G11-34 TaxID=2849605 RepID=UPI0022A97982|nr:alpha/beta hydrolase [Sporosarcina sp. G11-34]MCZ2260721.1 alpha/beta hydrolase [Sporosarcina sp. G11-34]
MWKWEAEGQPKAVVAIVHSAYEHHSRYAWLIKTLRNNNFHVVMGDLPGHGSQAVPSVHDEKFDSYIGYVKELLKIGILDGLPLFIMGHGLGATIVMRILQTEEVLCAGVILSSPWLHLDHQPSKYSKVLSKLSSSMKVDHNISTELLTRDHESYIESRADKHYSSMITTGWYKELQNFMKTVGQHQGAIRNTPVLLHVAGNDKITDSSYGKKWLLNQNLTEFQFKEWKRLYHDVYQEPEREEVYLYTESFMHGALRSLGYIV